MLDNLKLPNETIDKIYDDGFHPAVSEIGKAAGRLPRLINAAFASLDCWIAEREFHVEKTKQLLEENLKNVDPDKIVPPEPYVAVPTIQALSYSMNSNELRALYANLLSKAIYSDTKDSVHPAYVEIIKNLSPLDCKIFDFIMAKPTQEIGCYEIRVGKRGEPSYFVPFPLITEIEIESYNKIAASIDNLSRNKLVNQKDFHFSDDNMYIPIRNTSFYRALEAGYKNDDSSELRPYKMSVKSTSFGRSFYNICSVPL